jgi:2,3-bisphosphoglycerate-dependent phosphoglycerate mutase
VEIILVRHALPVRIELETGIADPELSTEGHEQSKKMAAYLACENIDAVYASPLRRARETAQPLIEQLGIQYEICEGVAEFDRNSNEYVPAEELRATNDPRWQKMMKGEWDETADSPEVFRDRVISSINELVERHPGEKVAVVCHGGVINQYLAYVLGISTQMGFFYPQYTSIHRVAASRSGAKSIVSINESSHLR